jgi:hypothetical protein
MAAVQVSVEFGLMTRMRGMEIPLNFVGKAR